MHLRVFFCAKELKIDAIVPTLAECLPSYKSLLLSIWVVLSNRLNIVKFIPMKIVGLMICEKGKRYNKMLTEHKYVIYEFNLTI